MVKKLFIILFLTALLPFSANAQEVSFEAYIDRQNVSVAETFQIKLELINAQAESAPDLTVLPSDINVLGQQQQVSTSFVNGMQSQNVSWILDVMANKEGTYQIPSITVRTNAGPLSTKSFRIFVKSASALSANTSDNSVFIDVQVDKMNPYIDEPVLYKTIVYHISEISNAELVKPKSENAIVEQLGEPKPSRQILNGVNYKVIEVQYLITPLHTGKVEIEPSILRGKIARDFGNSQRTPIDALFAPFGNMGMAVQTKDYAPFTVASKTVPLDVKPAEAGVNPWLALYDLQIDDELSDVNYDQDNKRVTAKEGEPITRKVRITAYGKSGEALPELDNLFTSDDFKVYSDKAVNNKEFVEGTGDVTSRIRGTRTQTFTFIPQKSGMLTLPELNINYWSLKDNKIAKANLPGKVITIITGDKIADNSNKVKAPVASPPQVQPQISIDQQAVPEVGLEEKINRIMNSPQSPNLVILLLSFMICVIIFISFKVLTGARRNREMFDDELINPNRRAVSGRKVIADNRAKNNLVNINESFDKGYSARLASAQSYVEIQELLQKFAARYLNISQNSGTIIIAQALNKRFGTDKAQAMKYAAELDSVLYAGKKIDLDYLSHSFAGIIAEAEEKLNQSSFSEKNDDDLIALNPK